MCTGRICMVGRRYQKELTYETIEDVVESSGVEPRVIEQIFGQLKRLEAYNY